MANASGDENTAVPRPIIRPPPAGRTDGIRRSPSCCRRVARTPRDKIERPLRPQRAKLPFLIDTIANAGITRPADTKKTHVHSPMLAEIDKTREARDIQRTVPVRNSARFPNQRGASSPAPRASADARSSSLMRLIAAAYATITPQRRRLRADLPYTKPSRRPGIYPERSRIRPAARAAVVD